MSKWPLLSPQFFIQAHDMTDPSTKTLRYPILVNKEFRISGILFVENLYLLKNIVLNSMQIQIGIQWRQESICRHYIIQQELPSYGALIVPGSQSAATKLQYRCINYFSNAAQRNTLHLKFTFLQWCSAVVSAEMEI